MKEPVAKKEAKVPMAFRMSATGRKLIDALQEDTGISSQVGVVEFALREEAKRRGIKIKEEK